MRAAKRDAYKTAAMNAGEMAGGAGRGGHKRDGREGRMRQAGQARAAGRKARSAMPRAACRYRGKAGRRWQHLRAMRDFGFLDAKRGPWRQDSRAMYPKSPDCTREWMHRARMLPSRSRKACISGGCCQEEGLFRAFGERGMHTVRFLPARTLGPTQRERGTRAAAHGRRDRGDAGGTSRWQRPRRRFWICSVATQRDADDGSSA